jgi:hypothetical protein
VPGDATNRELGQVPNRVVSTPVRESKEMDCCINLAFKVKDITAARFLVTTLAISLVLSAEMTCAAPASRERSVDEQVATLIEKMLNKKTERQAFSELEALGCRAVPGIIERMDDRRSLPDRHIELRNKSPNAFEGIRHYGPQTVVDALAAILSQLTSREFGFISNGSTEAERTKTIQGWRDFLRKTPAAKLCDGG